jgi:hypothetical protein
VGRKCRVCGIDIRNSVLGDSPDIQKVPSKYQVFFCLNNQSIDFRHIANMYSENMYRVSWILVVGSLKTVKVLGKVWK